MGSSLVGGGGHLCGGFRPRRRRKRPGGFTGREAVEVDVGHAAVEADGLVGDREAEGGGVVGADDAELAGGDGGAGLAAAVDGVEGGGLRFRWRCRGRYRARCTPGPANSSSARPLAPPVVPCRIRGHADSLFVRWAPPPGSASPRRRDPALEVASQHPIAIGTSRTVPGGRRHRSWRAAETDAWLGGPVMRHCRGCVA